MRIRLTGAVVAVLAACVVAPVTASANHIPTYGRCLKVKPAKSGTYGNAGCTTTGGTNAGQFEWYPAVGGAKPIVKKSFTFNLKPKSTATFETVTGSQIACTGELGAGEFSSIISTKISTKFTGCTNAGFQCTSPGQAAGTILPGFQYRGIGYLNEPLHQVGATLVSETGGHFKCTGGTFLNDHYMKEFIISPVNSGKMVLKETVKFVEHSGKPVPEGFEESGRYPLLICESSSSCVEAAIAGTFVQLNEEKVEINPYVYIG